MGYTLFQSGYNSTALSNYGDASKFIPQGTWNLYWCYDHRSDTNMWCDCKIKTMWKNSTLSNPIHHSMDGTSPCNCLKLKGRCLFVNFGEMESVTCTSFYEAGWLALIQASTKMSLTSP